MNYPNPTTGGDHAQNFFNRMRNAGNANRPAKGNGYGVRRSTNGFRLALNRGPVGIEVTTYHLQEVHDEYLLCVTWDGETEGTEQIKIAKPDKLRSSVDEEEIDGITVTYSSYDPTAQTRHASSGAAPNTTEEDQVIVPRYLTDDVIFAAPVKSMAVDEDGEDILLLDLNISARAWAAS
jgi:hypothetical protein